MLQYRTVQIVPPGGVVGIRMADMQTCQLDQRYSEHEWQPFSSGWVENIPDGHASRLI